MQFLHVAIDLLFVFDIVHAIKSFIYNMYMFESEMGINWGAFLYCA